MGETLIAPDQTWFLWAVLLSAGAFGLWAEKTRWGSRLSGAVVYSGKLADCVSSPGSSTWKEQPSERIVPAL